ncbi:MAG: ATP-binding protein [Thiobacillus sp.]|uniref:sensor histidine kinase n=1 Tax=Thiobacillus sp. TaxID=924 RepID=UPI002894B592|nr:ATP-binding protein [Thiobacillus sp.]MDT3708207.1 ATP-binding protein [Thiobacillus sp.]
MRLPAPWLAQAHTIHRVVQVDIRRIIRLAALLGLAFSVLLAIPFVFYQRAETDHNLELLQTEQERVTRLAAGIVQQEMDAVLSDLRYLSQHNELSQYLAYKSPGTRLDLAREYLALASQKRIYDQIRFIDRDGMEQVRVDFNEGRAAIVAETELHDRRDQIYFREAMRLLPGQIYVSPLDLSFEPGAVEQPPRPVIRFAVPVADDRGAVRGIVVLNYLGQRLRDKLGALEGYAGRIRLLNAQGYWLMAADPEYEWGFIYPDRSQRSVAQLSPRLWRQIEAEHSGVYQSDASLIRFDRIYPLLGGGATHAGASFGSPVDADRYYWTVVVELSRSAMRAANLPLLKKLWSVYGVLVPFAFIVASMLAFASSRNRALAQGMEKVVDSVPVLVAYVDAEQRYRFNNMAYERFFGLKPKQIYGKSMLELLGEAVYLTTRPYIEQALAGNAVSFERPLHSAGEGVRDVSISFLPDTSPQGEVRGFYVVANDVTPIRTSQRRERQQMLELAHVSRLASMGQMATEIAHEINQPLAAIAMYSSAGLRTLRGECNREKMESWLEAMNTQAKRASEIVKRVRRFVQKGEPQLCPVDLNLIARETVGLLDHDARAQGVEMVLELAGDLPAVQGERVLLEQVVFNLVRNAMDAVLAGSGERRVTLKTSSDAHLVYVEVSDTGPGVDPELGEHIFDSFVTGKQGGLGMGLAISRSIAEAHAGSLRYANRPGGGATFTFSLAATESR